MKNVGKYKNICNNNSILCLRINTVRSLHNRTVERSNFKPIVHISALTKSESGNIHMVAITKTGTQLEKNKLYSLSAISLLHYISFFIENIAFFRGKIKHFNSFSPFSKLNVVTFNSGYDGV